MTALRTRLEGALGPAYAVDGEIGAGAMARVFAATETATGRRVAVKVLAPEVAACCDADRFRREMVIAAALDHPHIVPLLRECEVCGDGRLFYFVMPYVDGETLRARLDREGALPVGEAVRLVLQVAGALDHAHQRGVVHRDVKPGNILLQDGRALVADFGIAKAIAVAWNDPSRVAPGCQAPCAAGSPVGAADEVTGVGLAVGTPAYMAPEQAVGDLEVDHRADLYALGVLAYEMLAGAPPFAGRSPRATIVAHLMEEPPPLLERRPELPPALAALVTRLLRKSPDDRPRSAAAVVDALVAVDTLRLPDSSGSMA